MGVFRRAKNRFFEEEEKLPLGVKSPVDRALVTGYRVGGRAKKLVDGCKPKGERWIAKQKGKLGFLKKGKL